jgi:hypothetical protein
MSDMKFRLKIKNTIALFTIGFVVLSTMAAGNTLCVQAFDNAHSTNTLDLGNTFVVENYQSTGGKPASMDIGINSNFTGEGILNGTINITVKGNFSETFRNNFTSYIQGKTMFSTNDNGTAFFDFYAIGNYKSDCTFNSNGAVIFEDEAKGELSFLSNWIAIYNDEVDKNGTGTFLMWYLK